MCEQNVSAGFDNSAQIGQQHSRFRDIGHHADRRCGIEPGSVEGKRRLLEIATLQIVINFEMPCLFKRCCRYVDTGDRTLAFTEQRFREEACATTDIKDSRTI